MGRVSELEVPVGSGIVVTQETEGLDYEIRQ